MRYVEHCRERLYDSTYTPVAAIWRASPGAGIMFIDQDTSAKPVNFPSYTYGPKTFSCGNASGGTSGHMGGFSTNRINSDSNRGNIELLTVMAYDGVLTFNKYIGLFARGSGAAGSETCYYAAMYATNNTIALFKLVAGTPTTLAEPAFIFMLGYDYFFRFRVNGTSLKVRCWRSDQLEPSTWNIDTTDASIGVVAESAGWAWRTTANLTLGFNNLSFLSIGTNGDTAPTPRSMQDYVQFVAQDLPRVVLVELGVLGVAGGVGNPSVVCVGTFPKVTHDFTAVAGASEEFPNTVYDDVVVSVPNFKAQSTDVYTGRSTQSFGDLVVANENGVRDDWLLWNWGGRSYKQLQGGLYWPRWDFFTVLTSSISEVYSPGPDRIGFRVKDNSEKLNRAVNTTVLVGGSGVNAGKAVPACIGVAFNIPLTVYDASLNQYIAFGVNVNPSGAWSATTFMSDVRDTGISLKSSRTITAVDTGTETITVNAAHGGKVDSRVVFEAANIPAPLVAGTPYYIIAAGLTATAFRVSATKGGSAVNLTSAPTGCVTATDGWSEDTINGHNAITLAATPVGQVTGDVSSTTNIAASIISELAVLGLVSIVEGSVPGGLGDLPTFSLGFYDDGGANIIDLLDQVSKSVGATWWMNRLGVLAASVITLPPTDYDYEILENDVVNLSLKMIKMLQPAYPEQLGYKKNYTRQTSGLAGVSIPNQVLYAAEASFTMVTAGGAGLETASNHALARRPRNRVTLITGSSDATTEATRLEAMYRKVVAIFEIEIKVYNGLLNTGERVKVTHPRYGFVNGKNAIIVGVEENTVHTHTKLQIMCQLDGKWPSTTVGYPVVGEAYFY